MKSSTRNDSGSRRPGSTRGSLAAYLNTLQARGHYTFERREALDSLGVSALAFQKAARRLMAKRRIVTPRRGFFVVVPPEYSAAGAPPPSWYIADLMAFLGQSYYVGLLSAAGLHGASHQQPQEFQVMTDRPSRPAVVGRTRIRFFHKSHLRRTPTTDVKTYTGAMRVSTPEATAFDLVRYVESVGHLDNVATVLSELIEVMDPDGLVDAAEAFAEMTVIQRVGYLLDHVGGNALTGRLARWVAKERPRPTPLRPDRASRGAPKDVTWRVTVNDSVEPDT